MFDLENISLQPSIIRASRKLRNGAIMPDSYDMCDQNNSMPQPTIAAVSSLKIRSLKDQKE